jgi:hypothetical protein
MDTTSTVLHIDIAPNDKDSYLVELITGQRAGSVFRLQSCALDQGKLRLEFRAPDGREWWIYGEGYGREKRALSVRTSGRGSTRNGRRPRIHCASVEALGRARLLKLRLALNRRLLAHVPSPNYPNRRWSERLAGMESLRGEL